jgi:carboxylesterase type B
MDQKLSEVVESYWTNFTKSGDPNGPGLSKWVAWNTGEEPYIASSRIHNNQRQKTFARVSLRHSILRCYLQEKESRV